MITNVKLKGWIKKLLNSMIWALKTSPRDRIQILENVSKNFDGYLKIITSGHEAITFTYFGLGMVPTRWENF